MKCFVAKVLSRNLIVFARNWCGGVGNLAKQVTNLILPPYVMLNVKQFLKRMCTFSFSILATFGSVVFVEVAKLFATYVTIILCHTKENLYNMLPLIW